MRGGPFDGGREGIPPRGGGGGIMGREGWAGGRYGEEDGGFVR
jgi:hypothetical protein